MKQYNSFSDEQLLVQCSKGDMVCMNVLIKRYEEKLKSYIRTKVKRTDIVEDVFQDVCMKVYLSVLSGKYQEDGKFFSWVVRVAHNVVMDQYRRKKKDSTFVASEFSYNVIEESSFTGSEDSVEEAIIHNQNMELVYKLVHKLPAEQQEVVKLRHYSELSFKEIADETNVGVNTALGRFRYGIINLRNMMQNRERICV